MTRTTRDAANAAAMAVVTYAVLWLVSTQVARVRDVSPFADDPWDAFASFAAIFLPVVAGATWIRSLRHRDPILPAVTARRIRWGAGFAAAIVLVAAGADAVAIQTIGFPPDAGGLGIVLSALVSAACLLAIVAILLGLRAAFVRSGQSLSETTEPDIVDDLLALASDVAGAIGLGRPVGRVVDAIERFLDSSTVSPRRHRWPFGVIIAAAAAVAFDAWHAIREGPWIDATVAVLFGALVAAGVLAVYLGTVVPLRLLRPPRG